jgi:hypothetical protein
MAIDFRRLPLNPTPTVVMGHDIELVSIYKYLGTVLDNKLTFEENTYHLRKINSFNVSKTMMTLFY